MEFIWDLFGKTHFYYIKKKKQSSKNKSKGVFDKQPLRLKTLSQKY
jgi:hypothetical protein